ncbi:hypothetical protein G9C85_09360 [Halorubellus sp. JP-L1]|uniref:hypothetical protein n=1 Tax=Halorubellus sp. JP-L1 TaxID=2715753 RepID=UPI001408713A|nr:hypothetical protein [Halorubellus sp. JP-L1]NHN41836.1 hypothetical protein [Halorubellus sp. JP-L1]
MEQKAESFLRQANDTECQLAVAPEWAYNIEWVLNHRDYLFANDSPLFVLGCAPIQDHTRQRVFEKLEEEEEFEVIETEDVECSGDEFLTPTIIPIKPAARVESSKPAVLVQYKTQSMSEGVLPNEQANLACGGSIWSIDPRNGSNVIVWTCSDIMNGDLREEVAHAARQYDSFVVHVQCNPDPFHQTWIDFRNDAFNGSDFKVTYVAANWGQITIDGDTHWFGYSGVYSKAKTRSPLYRYDTTYDNGGLVGTKPGYHCDHVWVMANDAVSRLQFERQNPGDTAGGDASFSQPRIMDTWSWDESANSYNASTPGVPECTHQACDDWRAKLPDSALARELSTAIALRNINFDELPDGESDFDPARDLTWAAVETLSDRDGTERLGHVFSDHSRRRSSPVPDVQHLVEVTDWVANHGLCMDDEFSLSDVPMNARYTDKPVQACLMTTNRVSPEEEDEAAEELHNWVLQREPQRFKPLVATLSASDGLVLKTLKNYEDAGRVSHGSEDVSNTGGLVRVNE